MLSEILCVPFALATDNGNTDWNEPLIIRTNLDSNYVHALHIRLEIDRANQTIQSKIEVFEQQKQKQQQEPEENQLTNFTEIEARLPLLDDKQSDIATLQEFLLDMQLLIHISVSLLNYLMAQVLKLGAP